MKKASKKSPILFPVTMTVRLYDLTGEEGRHKCRAMAVYPDGLAYCGEAVIVRDGPTLRVSFKGQM